jgi:hypothetical protein
MTKEIVHYMRRRNGAAPFSVKYRQTHFTNLKRTKYFELFRAQYIQSFVITEPTCELLPHAQFVPLNATTMFTCKDSLTESDMVPLAQTKLG